MTRLCHIFAILAFAFALLTGAVGGAMAHAGATDHHGSHQAPGHANPHKATPALAAPCCPAAEAPAKHVITVTVRTVETSWHPRPEHTPSARAVAPEPHPPKTAL